MSAIQRKLVACWGINDSTTKVTWKEGGKKVACRHYVRWQTLLHRCLTEGVGLLNTRYYFGTCTISEEFQYFSEYRQWEKSQLANQVNSRFLALDKDIIIPGNTIYSKETCCLVPKYVNTSLLLSDRSRGELPVGVTRGSRTCVASISVGGVRKVLGSGKDPIHLHTLWQREKIKAILYTIERYRGDSKMYGFLFREDVAEALSMRARLIEEDLFNGVVTIKI